MYSLSHLAIYLIILLANAKVHSGALLEREIDSKSLTIHSMLYLYGDVNQELASELESRINDVWNSKSFPIELDGVIFSLKIKVSTLAITQDQARQLAYRKRPNPRHMFVRILETANSHINTSFMLNNLSTGIWLKDQVMGNLTTAAHEFGHALGLDHPEQRRHEGHPRIAITDFYHVDSKYWIRPELKETCTNHPLVLTCSGAKLDLDQRMVTNEDIKELDISTKSFNNDGKAFLGGFTRLILFDAQGLPLN